MTEKHKLFVGSLPLEMTDEGLKKLFSKFGEITEAIVIRDKNTHKSKQYGFITFMHEADGNKAIETMDQFEMEGKKMLVTFAKPTSSSF